MTTSHRAGPDVVFGQTTQGPTPDYNPDIGTSLFFGSTGTLDQRGYWAYQPGNLSYQGWLGSDNILTLNGGTTGGAIGDWFEIVDILTGYWAIYGLTVVPIGSHQSGDDAGVLPVLLFCRLS